MSNNSQLLLFEPVAVFDRLVITSNSSRSELGDIWAPIGDGRAPIVGALHGSAGRVSSEGAICITSWLVVLCEWLRLGDCHGSAAGALLCQVSGTGLVASHGSAGAAPAPPRCPLVASGAWAGEPFCSQADSADDPDDGDWVRESQLSTLAVPAGRATAGAADAPAECHGSAVGEVAWPWLAHGSATGYLKIYKVKYVIKSEVQN